MNRLARLSLAVAGVIASIGSAGCATTAEEIGDTSQELGQSVDVPNPSGAYFARVTANGSGCPSGSWDANISPDGKAFTVTFSQYETLVEPSQSISIKDCTVSIDLKTPAGFSFSVSSFHYQGYALLDQPGMSARQTAKYYFQGNPLPAKEIRSDMTGPYDSSYVFSDEIGVTDLVWSACGAQRTLNAQTRIVLQNNPEKTGSGYLNTTSVDAEMKTVFRFGLSWKQCGAPPPPPPPACGTLAPDGSLAQGQSVSSCDGHNTFVHQHDGNVVLYHDGQPLWATHTMDAGSNTLVMQRDGNLVEYARGGSPMWASNTAGHPGSRLTVQNDCNVVIYDPQDRPLWSTQTQGCVARPSCGILASGAQLRKNESVKSCDGRNVFAHQDDGNIVLYHDGRPLWATNRIDPSASILAMQTDGNLVQYSGSTPLWFTSTHGHGGARLAVQDDCNVVIYDTQDRPLWSTQTHGCVQH